VSGLGGRRAGDLEQRAAVVVEHAREQREQLVVVARRLRAAELLQELRHPAARVPRDEVASGAAVGARVGAVVQRFGLAEREEVKELELGREVVGQLARVFRQREAEVVVEPDDLFHRLHARVVVEASVERARRPGGSDLEQARVLDREAVLLVSRLRLGERIPVGAVEKLGVDAGERRAQVARELSLSQPRAHLVVGVAERFAEQRVHPTARSGPKLLALTQLFEDLGRHALTSCPGPTRSISIGAPRGPCPGAA